MKIESSANEHARWREDDDMRTILEARKIQADEKRMDGVRRAAKRKLEEQEAIKALVRK